MGSTSPPIDRSSASQDGGHPHGRPARREGQTQSQRHAQSSPGGVLLSHIKAPRTGRWGRGTVVDEEGVVVLMVAGSLVKSHSGEGILALVLLWFFITTYFRFSGRRNTNPLTHQDLACICCPSVSLWWSPCGFPGVIGLRLCVFWPPELHREFEQDVGILCASGPAVVPAEEEPRPAQ